MTIASSPILEQGPWLGDGGAGLAELPRGSRQHQALEAVSPPSVPAVAAGACGAAVSGTA